MRVRVIVTCRGFVMLHTVTLRNVLLICMYSRLYKVQLEYKICTTSCTFENENIVVIPTYVRQSLLRSGVA